MMSLFLGTWLLTLIGILLPIKSMYLTYRRHFALFINQIIDFNSISTRLGLFYAQRIRNYVQFIFIDPSFVLLFFGSFFFILCTHSNRIKQINSKHLPIDMSKTSTTTQRQSGPGSNSNETLLPTNSDLRKLPMQFGVFHRKPSFLGPYSSVEDSVF